MDENNLLRIFSVVLKVGPRPHFCFHVFATVAIAYHF